MFWKFYIPTRLCYDSKYIFRLSLHNLPYFTFGISVSFLILVFYISFAVLERNYQHNITHSTLLSSIISAIMATMNISEATEPCAFNKLFTKSVPHILEKIFFSLDYKSFKICKEVSNSWNDLLTLESFKRMGKSVFREVIVDELVHASFNGNSKEVRSIITSGQ